MQKHDSNVQQDDASNGSGADASRSKRRVQSTSVSAIDQIDAINRLAYQRALTRRFFGPKADAAASDSAGI
jgi:hypothetical protein